MLVLTASSNIRGASRARGSSEEEVRAVVAHWRRQGRVPEPVVGIDTVDHLARRPGAEDDDDELLAVAMELVVRSQLGSTSMLQRKLRVGSPAPVDDDLSTTEVVRPARAKPTRNLRWSIEVDPSWERTTSSMATASSSSSSSSAPWAPGEVSTVSMPTPARAPDPGAASGPRPLEPPLRRPRALEAPRDVRRGGEHQHVALTDQPLGAGLVQDDPAVGERGDRERHPARNVRLDDPGDDIDRGALRGEHQVDADRPGHLGDAHHRIFDVTSCHHHQVVELVDDDEDEREAFDRAHGLVELFDVVVVGRLGVERGPRSRLTLSATAWTCWRTDGSKRGRGRRGRTPR